VKEVNGKEPLTAGTVYLAPADQHLLVNDGHLEVQQTERINFSRPSIDVLFQSVAKIYGQRAIGVLLSGAGRDGATGLHAIKARGGMTVVQDPGQAKFPSLPRAAIAADGIDFVLPIESIGPTLMRLVSIGKARGPSNQAVGTSSVEAE
jgi:two-component system chemotaxis response regulator CheB